MADDLVDPNPDRDLDEAIKLLYGDQADTSNPFARLLASPTTGMNPQTISARPQDTIPQIDPAQPTHFRKDVRGPFGSHGALADILGTIGDLIGASAGLGTPYHDKVMAAKEADAMAGYQQDPRGAILKLAAAGGTKAAIPMMNALGMQQVRDQSVLSSQHEDERKAALAPSLQELARSKVVNSIRGLASTANAKNASAIAANVRSIMARNGIDPKEYGFPDSDDPNDIVNWSKADPSIRSATSGEAYKDTRLEQLQAALDIQQQRADQTASHQDAMEGIASGRAGETARHNRATEKLSDARLNASIENAKNKRNGRLGLTPPPPPPGGVPGLRIVGKRPKQ